MGDGSSPISCGVFLPPPLSHTFLLLITGRCCCSCQLPLFLFLLIPCCLTMDLRAPPIIPNIPFLWAWNAPTEFCSGKFNEPLDMSLFFLTGSPRKTATGQGVTIFYTDRLGYYPHIDVSLTSVHGGIPQLGSLQDHLAKAQKDILHYMPIDNVGLAVIDWEDWRPTWERNWKPKDIYKNKSIELVQQRNVNLNVTEATKIAKEEFEKAGRSFMEDSLKLGKSLRPNHLWGFYLFPDCYNHNNRKPNYNGQCPDKELQRNDALNWIWEESTALYPSIYLKSDLRSSQQAALFVRNRVQEAIRVSKVADAKSPLPIFVYIRLVFTDLTMEFLSEEDLVHTIGETIALGASGIVVWGTLGLARSMVTAKMCSQVLCQNQGVCSRKNWDSDDYLHLNSVNFDIEAVQGGKYVINGKPTLEDLQYFTKKFHCSCYTNLNCKERLDCFSLIELWFIVISFWKFVQL
uniref:Hyaluronidase n=1 Tax=Castor canadensis TaxID=51338 RepID=A0A8C0ZN80_CASCN